MTTPGAFSRFSSWLSVPWMVALAGALVGFGHFFMKRLSGDLADPDGLAELVRAVLRNPNVYAFVAVNGLGSIAYVFGLRRTSLVAGFVVITCVTAVVVLALDVLVNRASLSAVNVTGLGLGLVAVALISIR